MIYGYARVSAPGQDTDLQLADLTAAGCERIFSETASAAQGRKRPQLAKLLAALEPGDQLVVKRLNRVARSARDALNIFATVSEKGAVFRSLGEPWADGQTPAGRFMVTVFSGLAELDRELILERTAEGRKHAKARGVKMGRPPTLSRAQVAFVRRERDKVPPMAISDLQTLLGASRSTITRAANYDDGLAQGRNIGTHRPGCAILGAGNGSTLRCTCGDWKGMMPAQIDLEEAISRRRD